MIITAKQAREQLRDVMAVELDEVMLQHGFVRRSLSMNYTRPCAAGRQLLEFKCFYRPRYEPGAILHIYPDTTLEFPEINLLLPKLDSRIVKTNDVTMIQPLDHCIPSDKRVMWFTYGRDEDCVLSIRSIEGYLMRWGIPFLNDYTTIESLSTYLDTRDTRLTGHGGLFMSVVAACVLTGRLDKAKEALEAWFGKPRLRDEFAGMHAYVNQLNV